MAENHLKINERRKTNKGDSRTRVWLGYLTEYVKLY